MKVNIEAPWEVNKYTNTLINEKLGKLTQYYDGIIQANVFLKKGSPSKVDSINMEVVLRLPGPELIAKSKEDTVEQAVAACAEKLRKQLIRRKEKSMDR